MNRNRIEKYINTIEPVCQGGRNKLLHNTGLKLRANFGLHGNHLSDWLQSVNQDKCSPPLSFFDVHTVARSVDRSNVPLGVELNETAPLPNRNKPHKTTVKQYGIQIADKPANVSDILKNEVSIYTSTIETVTRKKLTIGKILKKFKIGGESKERILTIRNETDKNRRSELKKKLPGIVFASEPQTQRNIKSCKSNGVLCLDFDNIELAELEWAKDKIAEVPYVFAVGMSVSGLGLFALVAYEGTPNLKHLLECMQDDFDYELDKTCSDISRLRFVTFDPTLIVKDEVFPAILTATTLTEPKSQIEGTAPHWSPFPLDRLPPTLRNIAKAVQHTIGLSDSSTAAIAALATVSGIIGSSCKIRIKEGYLQPAHLYTAIIGKSGQSKSGTKEYLIDPLQDKQGEWYENWEQKQEQYKRDMVDYKSTKKGERPELPIEPDPPKRIIVSDITIEAVGQRLKENPLGLLLYNDELDSFFGNMGRYNSGKDLPHWLSIHNGKTLAIDRKSGDFISIANPAVTIIGGIQPYILKERLKESPDYLHSGFLARFLLAMPPVEAILLNDHVIPERTRNQWNTFLHTLLEKRESAFAEGKVKPHVFSLEPSAWDILKKYQHRHAQSATFAAESESPLEGKFLTNAARIALILHVVKQIETKTELSKCMPIPTETIESACIIAEWFIDESKRIYAMLAGDITDNSLTPEQRDVLTVLIKHQPATERDIKRHSTQIKNWERGKLESVLMELMKLDRVVRDSQSGKGNRGTTWWRVKNSYTDGTDTDANSVESEKYGINGSVSVDDEVKTISEFDAFGDQSPHCTCTDCVHFTSATYPNGLCAQGYCQQDLPCYDFTKK